MGSTNLTNTFIQISSDCPVDEAQVPPTGGEGRTVAAIQYELITGNPYALTSDDVVFEVHAINHGIPAEARQAERDAFFTQDQAGLRSSPLAQRFGWGIHHDAESRVALVPLGSDEYEDLAGDVSLTQITAARSR